MSRRYAWAYLAPGGAEATALERSAVDRAVTLLRRSGDGVGDRAMPLSVSGQVADHG